MSAQPAPSERSSAVLAMQFQSGNRGDPPTVLSGACHLVLRPKPGEPSHIRSYQLALLTLIDAISEITATPFVADQLAEFNQIFRRAEQYGGFSVDWAGCQLRTKCNGAVFQVEIVKPNPWLEARFAEIAKRLGDAHFARCFRRDEFPTMTINYNADRRTFHMAALAG